MASYTKRKSGNYETKFWTVYIPILLIFHPTLYLYNVNFKFWEKINFDRSIYYLFFSKTIAWKDKSFKVVDSYIYIYTHIGEKM